jgi:hypothetical protein
VRLAVLAAAAFLAGCSGQSSAPPPVVAKGESDDHDHSHERGKMMLADAGPYHAALTAHLAKDGNELDVFFETTDKDPKPVALAVKSVTATAKRAADGKEFALTFEPAPEAERKGDEPGKCSHFVAKAPWMTAADVLTVTAELTIRAKLAAVEWKDFSPKKYAHHED